MKLAVLSLLTVAAFGQQHETAWVPYTATYVETVEQVSQSGATTIQSQTVFREIRSSDGSLVTVKLKNGEPVSARLSLADGRTINLDYETKTAAYGSKSVRRHPYAPPDSALGSIVLTGEQFTGFPVHMEQGSGSIWVNMSDDILGRVEIDLPGAGGSHTRTVREVKQLDLVSPVNASMLRVPADFKIVR